MAAHNDLPWGADVTDQLASFYGYEFTGKVVIDQGYIKTYEVKNNGKLGWARVINLESAPTGYAQKMLPEGLSMLELDELGEYCVFIDEIVDCNPWIFIMTAACHTTMANINRDRPLWQDKGERNRDWFRHIVAGLTDLHAQGYFHGDLCPENILIDRNFQVKLTGFSLVPTIDLDRSEVYVGPNYRFRPPRLGDEPNDDWDQCSADVWALGVLMFEILTGEYLVDPGSDQNQYFENIHSAFQSGEILNKIRQNNNLSDQAKDIIERLLIIDEDFRPKIGWVADHDYFEIANVDLQDYDFVPDLDQAPRGLEGSNEYVPPKFQLEAEIEQLLTREGISIKKYLASGFFGAVYRVNYRGQYAAMKVQKLDENTMYEMLATEEELAISLRHPYIIHTHNAFRVPNVAVIFIMELAFTDLDKQIDALGKTSRSKADLVARNMKKYLQQYAQGLAYCHSLNIAHNDIKPDNCLIRDNDTAAVADFGIAIKVQSGSDDQFERYAYDVECVGDTIEKCLVGVNKLTEKHVPSGQKTSSTTYPTIPSFVHLLARDLINACRHPDKKRRLSMAQVAEHRWFKSEGPNLPTEGSPSTSRRLSRSGSHGSPGFAGSGSPMAFGQPKFQGSFSPIGAGASGSPGFGAMSPISSRASGSPGFGAMSPIGSGTSGSPGFQGMSPIGKESSSPGFGGMSPIGSGASGSPGFQGMSPIAAKGLSFDESSSHEGRFDLSMSPIKEEGEGSESSRARDHGKK